MDKNHAASGWNTAAPAGGTTVMLTTGGTATRGTDYTLSSAAIAAGGMSGTATITVVDALAIGVRSLECSGRAVRRRQG